MPFRSRRARLCLTAACLLGAAFYLRSAAREYWAARAAQRGDVQAFQRASALQPGNAEYNDRLATLLLEQGDFLAAKANAQRAVALNPHAARHWLSLAAVYQVQGDTAGQELALQRAVQADPFTPDVAWQAGIFYLVSGDLNKALQQLQIVLRNDSQMAASVLELGWRATHDANLLLDKLVDANPELYLKLLNMLANAGEEQAAAIVWSRALALQAPLPVAPAVAYIDHLVQRRDAAGAARAWNQLLALLPDLQAGRADDNLIYNPGFERDALDGGFDWRFRKVPGITFTVETSRFHGGTHALEIAYDADSNNDAGVWQFVPVEPNTRYSFHGYVQADELVSNSGPRFCIQDVRSNRCDWLTEDVIGSTTWRRLATEFVTGPDCKMVLLSISRQPGTSGIRGQIRIDDLQLSPVP